MLEKMVTQSGRGRGRGRGRSSGRGRSGRGRGSSSTGSSKRTEYKYVLGVPGNNASDFNEVTKHLLNEMQKSFVHGSDIQCALPNKKEFDFKLAMPTKEVSIATDADTGVKFIPREAIDMYRWAIPRSGLTHEE